MNTDRVTEVQASLGRLLDTLAPAARTLTPDERLRPDCSLTAGRALDLFEDQLLSRQIDIEARRLKADGRSFYTISSAGHEQNAIVGALLRTSDPGFLHYRSGGLMMARARHDATRDYVLDTMLSICASSDDPTAEGRHKVWGSRTLWIPPQTSTIASHLPKAVGCAFALARARRMGVSTGLPDDAIVACSFGDASANHASALTAINAARYGHRRGNPLPILFICEDNGLGISVDTPKRWIRESFTGHTHLHYVEAEGGLCEVWDAVEEAIETCRESRAPVFLRLVTVRLWGHAGSDVELAYRSAREIRETESRDPLLSNARALVELGAATPKALREVWRGVRARVFAAAEESAGHPHLSTSAEVMRPLAPWDEAAVRAEATPRVPADRRRTFWGDEIPEEVTNPIRRTLGAHLASAMADEMLERDEILVFGEDVGRKGGVYYVTAGLQKRFGQARVIDTHLDETSILGLAQGAALLGLLPIPEIQYLAYVHNAVDQLRGEASSLAYFSAGQFTNPMVVRIASFAYQRGFGGHFHNDHSIGALRDIPGLILAAPSRGDDAVKMLRGCVAGAKAMGRVICFLEPIALYHQKDLHAEGDEGWLTDYPPPGEILLPGEIGVTGEGPIALVSYANGHHMCMRAAKIVRETLGIETRVIDLRWLNPLPFDALEAAVEGCERVLVVDECRQTGGGVADALLAELVRRGTPATLDSIAAPDSFVPLGPAADTVLIQVEDIVARVGGGPGDGLGGGPGDGTADGDPVG
ncbi:MAG: thiamine pyrophosphate-dependent enzyme [Longimicrobiales bacterium]|nr:thiamine pyrophosphate-dependent enzyme [Longimicrobiales bacterium]